MGITQKIYLGDVPVIKNYLGEDKIASFLQEPSLYIEFLVVGAGGGSLQGGGGGGQFITGSYTLNLNDSKSITQVGTGGSAGAVGGQTRFDYPTIPTAVGGGGGGQGGGTAILPDSGACGGGAGKSTFQTGGIGTAGFNGGNGGGSGASAGGGGGVASAGVNGNISGIRPDGGSGKQWLDGNYYCGGGGGEKGNIGSDGLNGAGGGNGNYGGGGGVTYQSGGNGVVKIRYAGAPVATGGTITEAGGYTYHTFTTTGTFTYTG